MCLGVTQQGQVCFTKRKVVSGHPVAKLAKLGFGSRSNSALFFFFFFAAHVLAESSPGTDRHPPPHPESLTMKLPFCGLCLPVGYRRSEVFCVFPSATRTVCKMKRTSPGGKGRNDIPSRCIGVERPVPWGNCTAEAWSKGDTGAWGLS